MTHERKQIVKQYLLLCEGRDAENFLMGLLNPKDDPHGDGGCGSWRDFTL